MTFRNRWFSFAIFGLSKDAYEDVYALVSDKGTMSKLWLKVRRSKKLYSPSALDLSFNSIDRLKLVNVRRNPPRCALLTHRKGNKGPK